MSRRNIRRHRRVAGKGLAANLRSPHQIAPGCRIENISIGGVYLRTDQRLPLGTAVVLDLMRRDRKPLRVSGQVVGTQPPVKSEEASSGEGLHIAFDALPPGPARALNRLVDELEASPGATTTEPERSRSKQPPPPAPAHEGGPGTVPPLTRPPGAPPLHDAFGDDDDSPEPAFRWVTLPPESAGVASSGLEVRVQELSAALEEAQRLLEARTLEVDQLHNELEKARNEVEWSRRELKRCKELLVRR